MRVFLIGWFGAGNMGDEAILLSQVLSLQAGMRDGKFFILSFDPERTGRLMAHIPSVQRIVRMGSRRDFIRSDCSGILAAFREADVVVIGGGGIFQDIYNHYPIPFFTSMALLARLHRKRLVLHCVGIGPIDTFVGRRLCRLTANLADMISVRDSGSRDLLRHLGIAREVYLSADPVFLLEPVWNDRVARTLETYRLRADRPMIGVCIHDLLFWSDSDKAILADTLDALIADEGVRVVFLPLGGYRNGWVRGATSDYVDAAASKKIMSLMKRRPSLIVDELTPQELLAVLGKMDVVLSMRLHGLIMSLNMGVPVVGLTYKKESKVANLMKRLNQENGLFHVHELDKRKLLERIHYLLSARDAVRRQLEEPISSLRAALDRWNRLLIETLADAKKRVSSCP